jgi:hypothetical protein
VRDKRARGGFAAEYKGGYCVVESQKSQKSQIIKIIIIIIIIIWRAPGPYGASPTQPYKCGQNVKVKNPLKNVLLSEFEGLACQNLLPKSLKRIDVTSVFLGLRL